MTHRLDIKTFIYIFIAFSFSIILRLVWVYQFSAVDEFFWNDQLMINTNDGYFFAEGARDILAGNHQENDLSGVDTALSKLTALCAFVLPFSFESIILFMPTFFSSLIVFPIILLGKELKSSTFGFIAALLASIAHSYYNRTMTGYYDTDMLNIVLPMFLLYFVIAFANSAKQRHLIFSSLSVILYHAWYPQSNALVLALVFMVLLYAFVYEKDRLPLLSLSVLLVLSVLHLHLLPKLVLLVFVYWFFASYKPKTKMLLLLLALSFALLVFVGNLNSIIYLLKVYVFRDELISSSEEVKLYFFTVMQTVRESNGIDFGYFTQRISGHIIIFILSIFGFVWLTLKHRIMILSLPMLGLGFLAYTSGLRFTIYAVPVMALGMSYLICKIDEKMQDKNARFAFLLLSVFLILLPNILHIQAYRVPTVFNSQEVGMLDKLKTIASREDYVVSWWDYGYPLRYYADVKTLADGGKHSGAVNFAPSFILTHDEQKGANLARLEVEYTEKLFALEKHNKALKKDDKNYKKVPSSLLAWMMKDYGFKNSNSFLQSLEENIKLPRKTRDIYLYLPYRMASIFPTIAKFSYRDLMTGKEEIQPFFYKATDFKDLGSTIILGEGISLDKAQDLINIGKHSVPIKAFYTTKNVNEKVLLNSRMIHENGLNVLYAASYGAFFVLDDRAFNSAYVQLFFLENYDKNLYELVLSNPYTKIYKLKR